MDYSKFLDDNFDVKDWVNAAFRSQKDSTSGAAKDQYATTLVMKLQMFIQEVNNIIEETCQQAVQNLPRVSRELEAVRQESSLLQEQMTLVKQDIQKVEQDTAQSMQMLLQLDSIKSRMKAASDALQEADNWTTLSANVEEVFQSGDIHAISEKLVGMHQSLQMLADVPDYAERCQLLENLKNRLEALLSPQLVAAFNAQSQEAAQMYVRIFKDIDRLPQLIKYYHKCHKSQLVQQWRTIVDNGTEETVLEWMTEFYDILLSTWHSQIKWCTSVFAEPVPVVCQLLTETLQSLEPSYPSCIANFLQGQAKPLPALILLKEMSERFAKSMEVALDSHGEGNQNLECVTKLAAAVYSPYRPYVKQYGQFEDSVLQNHLNAIPLDHEDVIDTVQLLSESVSKLYAAANQSNNHCSQLTSGCGYISLLEVLKKYFGDYVHECQRVLVNLREKCNMGSVMTDAEDWTLFQHSLRIIQTCGELLMHMDELDQSLISSIVTCLGPYYQPGSPTKDTTKGTGKVSPFQSFPDLLLESQREREELREFYTKLEEGDTPSVLVEVKQQLYKLCEDVHKFSFDIVFAPLDKQLSQVSTMEIWTAETAGGAMTSNLPTFSLSPQEYITKIGQYLMTLPQHVEPFTAQDHPALAVALKHGNLPYTVKQEVPDHLADMWLESTARGTMHQYSEQILRIHELSEHATKQLITDIDYLTNVLDDLGLQTSDTLKGIELLLKASQDEYSDISETMPQRLASAIASMRNLSLD